jgi:hypothetical protein
MSGHVTTITQVGPADLDARQEFKNAQCTCMRFARSAQFVSDHAQHDQNAAEKIEDHSQLLPAVLEVSSVSKLA